MPARIAFWRSVPFLFTHLACFGFLWCGTSWVAVAVCGLSFFLRMFAITAGYHRYFSHASFKTSRWFQFVLAWLGTAAMQKGCLWWAANHRHHHAHSDDEDDIHSPVQHGFWWSHTGWILTTRHDETLYRLIPDLAGYPELQWLNRWYLVPPLAMIPALWALGSVLSSLAPGLATSPAQMVVWGFFISTVGVYHTTFCINSVTHIFGVRRFNTRDNSRNLRWLAVVSLGEGWHNNHHYMPSSARFGFYDGEWDIAHWVLKRLEGLGLVWDLKEPARHVLERGMRTEVPAAP